MLWQKNQPIIRSILETDVYKILMLFYIYEYYPYLQVKWAFKNRKTVIKLAQYIDVAQLREELQAVAALRFTVTDIAYLRRWGMFPESFLKELLYLILSMPHVEIVNGELVIESSGTWMETTLWEIYILAIIAELYGRGRAAASRRR